MKEVTLDTAVFDNYAHAVQALYWYSKLDEKQRQDYIDGVSVHLAQRIQQFTVDAVWYITELGYEDGFDESALMDLWQRVRHKLHEEGVQ